MNQMSAADLLKDWDNLSNLEATLTKCTDATAVVRYENVDLSSRNVGQSLLIMVGPSNTMTTLEAVTARKTYPFQPPVGHSWQYYPQGWCPADEVRKYVAWRMTF